MKDMKYIIIYTEYENGNEISDEIHQEYEGKEAFQKYEALKQNPLIARVELYQLIDMEEHVLNNTESRIDAARRLDLWCYYDQKHGWRIPCDKSHPEATEDLNRLLLYHVYNYTSNKWEKRHE